MEIEAIEVATKVAKALAIWTGFHAIMPRDDRGNRNFSAAVSAMLFGIWLT